MRVAIGCHSTNPRGGVSHALALGESLAAQSHDVTVMAPDHEGNGFYRPAECKLDPFPMVTRHVIAGMGNNESLYFKVMRGIKTYTGRLMSLLKAGKGFDVYHAQDGISANSFLQLKQRRLIPGYVRTVHHMDGFGDDRLNQMEQQSIQSADEIICVSNLWAKAIHKKIKREPSVIPNGVNLNRYQPVEDRKDLREKIMCQYDLKGKTLVLSIGGIEWRKNSLNILKAFEGYYASHRQARLLIVGGASLLDHSEYQRSYQRYLSKMPQDVRQAVVHLGVLPDEMMPVVMRLSDLLVFPSIKEGFGMVVLEAMACGTPVVVSEIPPFTEYLAKEDCHWCDPADVTSITDAIRAALTQGFMHGSDIKAWLQARFGWERIASEHVTVYQKLYKGGPDARDAI